MVERWSRGASPLHARDARAKLGALLVFLVAVSTTPPRRADSLSPPTRVLLAVAMRRRALAAGGACCARAALVLPFSATFALITWWSGDPVRALRSGGKELPLGLGRAAADRHHAAHRNCCAALDSLGVPRPLILVIQFLYRYLFVISEQAQHMRLAARCRHGLGRPAIAISRGRGRGGRAVRAILGACRRDLSRHARARIQRPLSRRFDAGPISAAPTPLFLGVRRSRLSRGDPAGAHDA